MHGQRGGTAATAMRGTGCRRRWRVRCDGSEMAGRTAPRGSRGGAGGSAGGGARARCLCGGRAASGWPLIGVAHDGEVHGVMAGGRARGGVRGSPPPPAGGLPINQWGRGRGRAWAAPECGRSARWGWRAATAARDGGARDDTRAAQWRTRRARTLAATSHMRDRRDDSLRQQRRGHSAISSSPAPGWSTCVW